MPRNFPTGARVGNVVVTDKDGKVLVTASQIANDSGVDGTTVADVIAALRAAADTDAGEVVALRARVTELETTVATLEARGQ